MKLHPGILAVGALALAVGGEMLLTESTPPPADAPTKSFAAKGMKSESDQLYFAIESSTDLTNWTGIAGCNHHYHRPETIEFFRVRIHAIPLTP